MDNSIYTGEIFIRRTRYGLRLIGLRESALQLYSMGRAVLPTGHKRASKPPMLNSVKFPGIPPNKIQMFGNVGIEISMVGFVCGGLPRGESALQL
ncbi:MAG: hypothetical protein HOP36_05715 [Methyloglobulus sp.]|nr:hypothetical protein [Methyloglobulus sp.]